MITLIKKLNDNSDLGNEDLLDDLRRRSIRPTAGLQCILVGHNEPNAASPKGRVLRPKY